MNCWEILGIDPTSDHQKIKQAYEQQCKFASAEEIRELEQAYREATGQNPEPAESAARNKPLQTCAEPEPVQAEAAGPELNSHDGQIAREVVIQISALLNDQYRSQDANIWKAILCEPPADQPAIRREIGRQLEPQVRPLADNGTLPGPVARFLVDWFGWSGLGITEEHPELKIFPEATAEADSQQQAGGNIWIAMIGWIVGLTILATLFSNMGFQ